MSEIINVSKKNITEKIGIWYLASQILKDNKIENTGINQYHLFLWIKEYNKDFIQEDCIKENSVLKLPSTKEDIHKICRTKLKMNKDKEQVLDNDFCLKFKFNQILYTTSRTKYLDAHGNDAADLLIDDLDDELEISPDEEYITSWSYGKSKVFGTEQNKKRKDSIKMSFQSFNSKTPDELFEEFKKQTEKYTKKGLRNDVFSLIDFFKINEDVKSEFKNKNIQNAALEHKTTKETLELIIESINKGIKYYNGDIDEFFIKIQEQENEIKNCNNTSEINTILIKSKDFSLWEKLHWVSKEDNTYNDWTPAFNTDEDQNSGLKIAINDVWSYEITISNYRLYRNRFQYNLLVTFYDHFGLDPHDVKKFGAVDKIFKIWYYLQHAKRFKGKFKPFITTWIYEKKDIEEFL